jgi:hypothetical protein
MHILYVDDSGSSENPSERYFVLGAVAVFERGIYHQIAAADECVASFGLEASEAEVPLFVDSRASRLVQLADLVAFATWRRYEYSDGRFFDPIIPKFDSDGGILHGLAHRRGRAECYCPACHSRRWGARG